MKNISKIIKCWALSNLWQTLAVDQFINQLEE